MADVTAVDDETTFVHIQVNYCGGIKEVHHDPFRVNLAGPNNGLDV